MNSGKTPKKHRGPLFPEGRTPRGETRNLKHKLLKRPLSKLQ